MRKRTKRVVVVAGSLDNRVAAAVVVVAVAGSLDNRAAAAVAVVVAERAAA